MWLFDYHHQPNPEFYRIGANSVSLIVIRSPVRKQIADPFMPILDDRSELIRNKTHEITLIEGNNELLVTDIRRS